MDGSYSKVISIKDARLEILGYDALCGPIQRGSANEDSPCIEFEP